MSEVSCTYITKLFRSECKRTSVKKKTTDPQFHDHFVLHTLFGVPLLQCIIRISVWHQTLLADDAFLVRYCTLKLLALLLVTVGR